MGGGGGEDGGGPSLLWVLLHEAVDLEPVGPPAVPTAGLGHADHEALPQPAGLARRPVPFVDDALVAVLAVRDHCLVVAESPEEALAAFAGDLAIVLSTALVGADDTYEIALWVAILQVC